MTRSRSWNLRLNLDTFNAAYAKLFDPPDHAEFVNGLYRGMNQGKVPPDCSDAMAMGFEIGSDMRAESEDYISRASESGRKSAEHKSNRIQGTPQGTPQGTFNQSTIHNPQSTNPKPTQSQKPKKSTTSIPDELLPRLENLCASWPSSFEKDGHSHRLPKLSKAQDLWERMIRFFPHDDPEEMLRAGENHLAPQKVDDWSFGAKPKGFTIAMTNFYGQQARWKEFR